MRGKNWNMGAKVDGPSSWLQKRQNRLLLRTFSSRTRKTRFTLCKTGKKQLLAQRFAQFIIPIPFNSPSKLKKSWEGITPWRWPRRCSRSPTSLGPPWNAATTISATKIIRWPPPPPTTTITAPPTTAIWSPCGRRVGASGTCSTRISGFFITSLNHLHSSTIALPM